jgi:hypothetical protein
MIMNVLSAVEEEDGGADRGGDGDGVTGAAWWGVDKSGSVLTREEEGSGSALTRVSPIEEDEGSGSALIEEHAEEEEEDEEEAEEEGSGSVLMRTMASMLAGMASWSVGFRAPKPTEVTGA